MSCLSILSISNNIIIYELLELILSLLNSSSTVTKILIKLLYKLNTIEELYSFLIVNNDVSDNIKEVVLKIIKCLIISKQQISNTQNQCMNHIVFGGVMSSIKLNKSIAEEFLNLILMSSI